MFKKKKWPVAALTALTLTCSPLLTIVNAANPSDYLMTFFMRTDDENDLEKTLEITGVAIHFNGQQEEMRFEDLREMELKIDGVPTAAAYNENIRFNVGDMTIDGSDMFETHFYLDFTIPFTQPGVYVFSGIYKDMPFTSLPYTIGEGGYEPEEADGAAKEDVLPAASVSQPEVQAAETATPTAATVFVDGAEIPFDAYAIGGSNYFKLRDVAYTLNETAKQFEVSWDNEKNAIMILTGQTYTPAGGEMAQGDGLEKAATGHQADVILDGETLTMSAYNIDGSNYFKLRDVGEALDFKVSWDEANNAISITTTAGYTTE